MSWYELMILDMQNNASSLLTKIIQERLIIISWISKQKSLLPNWKFKERESGDSLIMNKFHYA